MKKFFVFICFVCCGLTTIAAEDTATGGVRYDVFAPEKMTGAKLNAKPVMQENCNFYLLPVSNGIAYASDIVMPPRPQAVDPYIFKYQGSNYIFIIDNGKKLLRDSILGISDTRENLFVSLNSLDKNNDDKITPDELRRAKIRLMRISDKGKLIINQKKDFAINRINYIDLSEIKSITNSADSGINGHYYIYLKNNKKIVGLVISADDDIINNLF